VAVLQAAADGRRTRGDGLALPPLRRDVPRRRALALTGGAPGRGRRPGGRRAARVLALALPLAAALSACGDEGPAPAPPPSRTARYASDGSASAASELPAKRRNLLLICLDTLRSDALSTFGGAPGVMPRTARFLETGVAFTQAASTAPWTAPSVASLLTGLLPSRHGAREFREDLRLLDAVPTLAEILGKRGWVTRAYTGGGWVSDANGMLQGFRRARHPFSFGAMRDPLVDLQAEIVGEPWFFFLHTYEAHDPYGAPPLSPGAEWPSREVDLAAVDRATDDAGERALARLFLTDAGARRPVFEGPRGLERQQRVQRWFERGYARDPEGPAFAAEMRAAYEAGARRLDDALGAYLEAAEARGLLEDTVVVLVSDHGEGFGEHGTMHHGRRLYDELIRVPLWIRAPGWRRARYDASVSLADVVPTALDLLGLPVPETTDGRSLVEPVEAFLAGLDADGASRVEPAGRPALSEERRNEAETGIPGDESLVSVRDERWKLVLVRDLATGLVRQERYDLAADPGETRPLAADPEGWSPAFREAVRRLRLGL
jgi:arylsulfatase A-like enzyme